MNKKYLKIIGIVLGVLLGLVLVANLGLNFWLKNQLPAYIKKNSDYAVNYKTLNVNLISGSVFATQISVKSKNPNNRDVMAVDGTVDTLSVSRIGIFDALVNKKVSVNSISLRKPNLKIILAKPVDKTGKKRTTPSFENIEITNGNLEVWKTPETKFLSVNDLDLNVKNLQLTEKSVEKKLPVVFDDYSISGKNFYFRPDDVYEFRAAQITTADQQFRMAGFSMKPLVSYADFLKKFPAKRNLFDVKAANVEFKDIILKDNKITLTNAKFINPQLTLYTTPKKQAKQKSFTYEVSLEDLSLQNANINILKPNGSRLFYAGILNMQISKFFMDEESAKGNIPFQYERFKIDGKDINYIAATQNILVKSLALNQKSADLRYIYVKPTASNPQKTLFNLSANQIKFNVNSWDLKENKLSLDAEKLLVNQLNGTIIPAKNPERKPRPSYDGIRFPLKLREIQLQDSNLKISDKNGNLMSLTGLNSKAEGIEMNDETVKSGKIFRTEKFNASSHGFSYGTQFYSISFNDLAIGKNKISLNNFAVRPKVSRSQFIRMIPAEKDLYDITAKQVAAIGSWDFLSESKFFNASQVTISGADANIFRSKLPKDDMTEKPLYSKLLRSIKFPLFIQNFDLKNSVLIYEEDTKASDGPGKLMFGNFNMNIKNLNSGKMKGKPTDVGITISTMFMNASPMNVRWNFNTLNQSDAFNIAGNIADLPASRINPFIEPYLKIRATGAIQNLAFNFHGNNAGLGGTMNMKHKDLKISILNKDGEKNGLLTAIANVFVRTDSGRYPESVMVDAVKRDPAKSFFNMFWKGIQEGLGKTLIGKNFEAEKAQETIKETTKDVKKAVKDVKQTVKKATQPEKPAEKKKGFFQKIFKKGN